MAEMTSDDIGVLRTRGMKVLHGSRAAEGFEPGSSTGWRTTSADRTDRTERLDKAERLEKRGRTDRGDKTDGALPGGLAGWVLGLMSRRGSLREARHLRVLETQALGGRRQLMLVVCDGERFLVGSGADRVDTIVKIGETARPVSAKSAPGIPVEEPCL